MRITNLRFGCRRSGLTIQALVFAVAAWPTAAVGRAHQTIGWTGQENLPHPHITVTATGEVSVSPDRAVIYFTLTSVEESPDRAAAANVDLRDRMTRALAPLGLSAEAVSNWGYGVGPRGLQVRRPDMSMPPEFSAQSGIRVTVNALERLDDVVRAGLAIGDVAIPLVEFDATDPSEARRAAISQAVELARRDAEALARAAGGSLGELLVLTSVPVSDFRNQYGRIMVAARMGDQQLQPTDVSVRVTVNAAWRFEN